jgi:hypothetical protein
MKRSLIAIAGITLVCFVGPRGPAGSAQVAVEEVPVVSTTYIPVPAPQQEIITEAPSPQHVWVAGHWDRTADSWSWVGGQWVQPPFSSAYWVPGYWQHQGGQYVWEDAHWAAAPTGLVAAKPVAAPPVYQEVVPVAAPSSVPMTWQPGHWEWRGTWVWIGGVYVPTAVPTAEWVAGRWLPATDGSWRWNPAHWESRAYRAAKRKAKGV